MSAPNPQLDGQGNLKHFLTIEGLDSGLLTEILDQAEGFLGVAQQAVKKVPLCRGKVVANLFFETSTRTRTTFELAAKRLSADVLNLNIATSATSKGETLLDTLRNLEAMHVDMFVVRHAASGAAHFIAAHADPHVSVINAGDGRHSHPTQGMLDMFTIRRHKGAFEPLCVAIVGDILHSRVARSQIAALNALGAGEVRVIAPRTLIPAEAESLGVRVFHDLREGVRDADVVIMLRLQRERMSGAMLPSAHEYYQLFGLTEERLSTAKPDAIVMHPGPINRGRGDGLGRGRRAALGDPGAGEQRHRHPHGRDVHVHRHPEPARPVGCPIGGRPSRGCPMPRAHKLSIRNGRLIDPASGTDQEADLHVADGRILAVGAAPAGFLPDRTLDARGLVVCPGFVDLAARLREPGHEQKATIASETRAAAAAGITTLCCPPDTVPIIDTPAVAQLVHQTAERHGFARVLPTGAITQGLEGKQITEMAALKQAGCPVLSQADRPIRNTQVLRRALEYASTFGITLFLQPLDPDLAEGGCAHEGRVATRLGLPGIPEAAETVAVARALALAEQTGARIHFRGLSSARGAEMLADARRRGVPASADVAMHQLFLTEDDLDGFRSDCHVIPPLRTLADRNALRIAVAEGAVSAVCSDHQPHDADAKEAPFPETAPGISALETLLPLGLRLVAEGVLDLPTLIARLTVGPAEILGHPPGRDLGCIRPGRPADVCVFDPAEPWVASTETLWSHGDNSPFLGATLNGRVRWTLLGGRLVQDHD